MAARPGLIGRVFEKADYNITRDNVENAIQKLNAGKAGGLDGVSEAGRKRVWC